jgi:hypothetical protein
MKIAFDLPEQVRSLSRFPIPVAIATILAVVLNLQAANLLHMSDAFESELSFACAGAFIASFAGSICGRLVVISGPASSLELRSQRQLPQPSLSIFAATFTAKA